MKEEKQYYCKVTGQECYHLLEGECDFETVTGSPCPYIKTENVVSEVAEDISRYHKLKKVEP